MLSHMRNKMPSAEEATEAAREATEAARERLIKAANAASQSAKEMSGHLEEWAKDGYESVKARPATWSAASLGFGVLLGGLYALWRNASKSKTRVARKSMPARSRPKQILRAKAETNGATDQGAKRKAKRTKRPRQPATE